MSARARRVDGLERDRRAAAIKALESDRGVIDGAIVTSNIEAIAPLSFDDLPMAAHDLLIALGDAMSKADPVRDYAARYRSHLAIVIHDHPDADPEQLAAHVSPRSISRFATLHRARIGPAMTLETLKRLSAALHAIFPDRSFRDAFTAEYARLRALADQPPIEQPFRYALAAAAVPAALTDLFDAIGQQQAAITKSQPSPDTRDQDDPKDRADRDGDDDGAPRSCHEARSVFLRFLGALQGAGIAIATLDATTLVSVEHLQVYIARACGTPDAAHVAACLAKLQWALCPLDLAPEIAVILASHGIQRAMVNTDYDTYVPAGVRQHLETALARAAHHRAEHEPGALVDAVAAKVRRALGEFYKANANLGVLSPEGIPSDLTAALFAYEATMLHVAVRTLVARLGEIKAGFDRVFFEAKCGSTLVLRERIKELKRGIRLEPVEVPDDIGPQDIERLGRKLIWLAWRRLRGLLATRNPYRNMRPLAEAFRNGLALIIFSTIALRVSNMAALMIDDTLKQNHTDKTAAKVWSISLDAAVTKNGEAIHQTLPGWVGAIIDRYIAEIRPLIAPIRIGGNDHVFWIARHGGALRPGGFQDIVPRVTLSALEVRLCCHLFRAIEASDEHDDATAALRHKGPAVTRTYYLSARSLERQSARRPGVKANDDALPDIDPARVVIGPRPRKPTGGA